MIYIILSILSIVILFSAICGMFRAGEKENICNYGYIEEDKTK